MYEFCITTKDNISGQQVLQRQYQNTNLSVLSGDGFVRFSLPGQREVFMFGAITGKFDSAGTLLPISNIEKEIAAIDAKEEAINWPLSFEGRYVIILIDQSGGCQVIPDQYGKMDVYIQNTNNHVTIASDMSLLPDSPSEQGYDQAALAHVLSVYGNRPPKKHTIYKNVRRLGVGGSISLQNRDVTTEYRQFSPSKIKDYGPEQHDDYADYFLSSIEAAGSQNGNLVYLSSGWDSTSILAGLVKVFGADKVQAVTGRMTYSDRYGVCNTFEIERAKKFAEYYGVKLDLIELDYLKTGSQWGKEARAMMLPHGYHNFTAVNHFVLANGAKSIAPDVESMFAGEISDGAHNLGFSQYASIFHPTFEFREYSDKMASYLFGPTFLSQMHSNDHDKDAVFNIIKNRMGDAKFDPIGANQQAITKQLFVSFFLRNARMPLWSIDNVGILTADGAAMYTEHMTSEYLDGVDSSAPDELYSWYMHLYNSFHWQGSTVATLSQSASHFGKTANLPFWDKRLQSFFSSMPENWGRGLDFNNTKYPLKEMLKNKLDYPMELQVGPHSYLYDVDPSFNHAAELIYRSDFKPYLKELLTDRSYNDLLDAEFFNLAYLDGLVTDYVNDVEVDGSQRADLSTLCQFVLGGYY